METETDVKLLNHVQNEVKSLSPRIYLVTDGLKSKYTKRDYRLAFNQFLRDGAKTEDYGRKELSTSTDQYQ